MSCNSLTITSSHNCHTLKIYYMQPYLEAGCLVKHDFLVTASWHCHIATENLSIMKSGPPNPAFLL
jgi:hypothetical protein